MAPHLPDELIERILAYVDPYDKITFGNIYMASSTFHRIAVPLAWRGIGGPSRELDRDTRSKRLYRSCQTLLEDRELASCVKEFRQYIGQRHAFSEKERPEWCSDLDYQQLGQVISSELRMPPKIANLLMKPEEDGWSGLTDRYLVCVLVAICPNLERLEVVFDGSPQLGSTLSPAFREVSIRSSRYATAEARNKARVAASTDYSSGFHSLRELHLECDGRKRLCRKRAVEWFIVQEMFSLPFLRKLSVKGLHRNRDQRISAIPPAVLEELEIVECSMEADDLNHFLCIDYHSIDCTALTSISIEWTCMEENFLHTDWAQIGQFFRLSCPLLRRMSLSHPNRDVLEWNDPRRNPRNNDIALGRIAKCLHGLGYLKSLRQLTSLKLSTIALFGTHRDQLPGFLQSEDPYNATDRADSELYSQQSKFMRFAWRRDEAAPKHTLESLLPDCVKDLTVLCKEESFSEQDLAILDEPGATRLGQNLRLMNRTQNRWAKMDTLARSIGASGTSVIFGCV